jgi:hypothetical protein
LRDSVFRQLQLRLFRGETLRLLLNPSLVFLDSLLIRIHGPRAGWLGRRSGLRRWSRQRHDARHHDRDSDDDPLL